MKKKAVIIGIIYHGNPYPEQILTSSAIDVRLMKDFLSRRGYEIQVITDDVDDHTPNKWYPGETEILESLKWLVRGASRGDQLFLHYSGHGDQSPTDSKTETDGMDEVMRPARGNPIRDNQLRAILVDKLPPGCQLVATLDCCHSGTLLDLQFRATSHKTEVQRHSDRALVRGWRWMGQPAVYSVRLKSPSSTPLHGKRTSSHPTPPGAQILVKDPSLLRWPRVTVQPSDQPEEEYFESIVVEGPVTEPPSQNLEATTTPATRSRKPSVKKWILKQLSCVPMVNLSKGKPKTNALPVESPPQTRQTEFVQSPSSYTGSTNSQSKSKFQAPHQAQCHYLPLASVPSVLPSNGTTKTVVPTPVAQSSPVEKFNARSEDAGYDVVRRGTFAAFHTPSEDLKRVIAYSACTDDQKIFDIDGQGGLLTSRFIEFMDAQEHTLAGILIKLTEEFAKVNEIHEHGIRGNPPSTSLCTADHVNLNQQLVI